LSATGVGENDIVVRSSSFFEPGFHDCDNLFGKRRTSFFAALAVTADMSTRRQDDIAATDTNELRKTKAGLDGKQNKCSISSSSPGGFVRGSLERLNFRMG
jgi:hypothetical protein